MGALDRFLAGIEKLKERGDWERLEQTFPPSVVEACIAKLQTSPDTTTPDLDIIDDSTVSDSSGELATTLVASQPLTTDIIHDDSSSSTIGTVSAELNHNNDDGGSGTPLDNDLVITASAAPCVPHEVAPSLVLHGSSPASVSPSTSTTIAAVSTELIPDSAIGLSRVPVLSVTRADAALAMEEVPLTTQVPPVASIVKLLEPFVNHELVVSMPTRCSRLCLSDMKIPTFEASVTPCVKRQAQGDGAPTDALAFFPC